MKKICKTLRTNGGVLHTSVCTDIMINIFVLIELCASIGLYVNVAVKMEVCSTFLHTLTHMHRDTVATFQRLQEECSKAKQKNKVTANAS